MLGNCASNLDETNHGREVHFVRDRKEISYGYYNIVRIESITELVRRINEMVDEGWTPMGGAFKDGDIWCQAIFNPSYIEKQKKLDEKKKAPSKKPEGTMEQRACDVPATRRRKKQPPPDPDQSQGAT